MEQKKKELLIKDLCARQPHGVKIKCLYKPDEIYTLDYVDVNSLSIKYSFSKRKESNLEFAGEDKLIHKDKLRYKPYLRPLSSMTKKELDEFRIEFFEFDTVELMKRDNSNYAFIDLWLDEYPLYSIVDAIDWLTEHHFDCHNLIEKDLALEAPEGMYNLNN